jgi:hypothetical protein
MGILINTTDFVGKYAIAQNSFSKLGQFITDYETNYLYDLLGKTLADAFIATVSNNLPVGASYLAIYNVIELDLGYRIERNEGMKNMLLGFIYFEFMRKDPIKSTIAGQSLNSIENGVPVIDSWGMTSIYNSSVNNYQIIQYYINQNLTDYPNYKGQYKGLGSPI